MALRRLSSVTVLTRRSSFAGILGDASIASPDHKAKQFLNGDHYDGSWKDGLPEGEGRYKWADGSVYEGSWKRGMRHGVGQYTWPSGASYQGEWRDGHIQGIGTLEGPPPPPPLMHSTRGAINAAPQVVARYQGGWLAGVKSGLGKQVFSNGDVYEGLWRAGLPHGPGRYLFADGAEYDGHWSGGLMHGSGTFVWSTGERYDGQWKDGQPHGTGVLVMPDGSAYDAQWQDGRRHGICMYLSADHHHHHHHNRKSSSRNLDHSKDGHIGHMSFAFRKSIARSDSADLSSVAAANAHSLGSSQRIGDNVVNPSPLQPPALPSAVSSLNHAQGSHHSTVIAWVREYMFGALVREWPVAREDMDCIMSVLSNSRVVSPIGRLLRKQQGANSGDEKKLGEMLTKGHKAYDVMLNLQLGIRYSVSRVTPEAVPRELPPHEFKLKVKQFFPRQGSDVTPVHACQDFTWKDYAPLAFRKLRELFNVEAGSYMDSICSDAALRLLNSPGKSGSVFFLSHDDRYFVKTLKKGEARLLARMLPTYLRHMACHPHTLLTKFYGLHCIQNQAGKKMYLVVMANLFNTAVQLHTKFDLKGSRVGRTAGPGAGDDPHTIFKDLDLNSSFRLEDTWLERLSFQLKADCALLASCHIMDYSLLLGVNYQSRTVKAQPGTDKPSNFPEAAPEAQRMFSKVCERVAKSHLADPAKDCLLILARDRLQQGVAVKAAARRSQAQDYIGTCNDLMMTTLLQENNVAEQLALQLGHSHTALGVNMPAMAISHASSGGAAENVVLYFGIIDILQDYNPSKRLEHNLKSIVHDSYGISVTDPDTYAQRFQSFLRSVFVQ